MYVHVDGYILSAADLLFYRQRTRNAHLVAGDDDAMCFGDVRRE